MVYYLDYEALEFKNSDALKEKIYPYYLNPNHDGRSKKEKKEKKELTSLCPIYLCGCTKKGNVVCSQNVYKEDISFLRFLDKSIHFQSRTSTDKTIFIWFHNIAYDFRIIVHELFFNGFVNAVDSEKIIYSGAYRVTGDYDKSFSIVGKNLSDFIGINLYYKGFKILIRDTMSIMNEKQDKILESFGYPKKTEVDFNAINIKNLKENMPLIKERCTYDVTSLAKCIEEFKNEFYKKFHGKGSTASAMSLDAFKYYLCNLQGIDNPNTEQKEEIFRNRYPKITGLAKTISDACYNGGISTINPNHASKILRRLQMIDINSSYPNSMTLELPYGEPIKLDNFSKNLYGEYVVYISFEMKGTPFQRCHTENIARSLVGEEPLTNIFSRSQFPKKFEGFLCLNSIDIKSLKKYAKVKKLEFYLGYGYKTDTVVADFIKPIYKERQEIKKQGKEGNHVLDKVLKIILNSLYGKFAQDLSGIVYQYDDVNNFSKIVAIDTDSLYKPLASTVTAYSRQNWINATYIIGDDFIYGDTDSIYFKNIDACLKKFNDANLIHPTDLGKWALDDDYSDYIIKGKFLSKKNYLLELTETDAEEIAKGNLTKLKVTCVGLSHKYHKQVNFNNFYLNSEAFKIRKMVNIYGGKAMRETVFKIRERVF